MVDQAHAGGCLCGHVRYRVTGQPLWVAHCHCQSCRRHTGAPMTSFVGVNKRQFRFITDHARTIQSSIGVRRRFCPMCGTPLTYEADRVPDETHVYLATLDDADAFKPSYHVFTEEAMPWLKLDDGLRRYPRLSRDAASAPEAAPEPRPATGEIAGGCLCRAVRYRLIENLGQIHLCHCRMCQKSTGSPFAGHGVVTAAALRFTQGAPKLYRSSERAQRGFCGDCGSPLIFQYDGAGQLGVAIGSLDRPDALRLEFHYGIESRLPWIRFADGLPEHRTREAAGGDDADS